LFDIFSNFGVKSKVVFGVKEKSVEICGGARLLINAGQEKLLDYHLLLK
jgi:hypothetical protein